MPFSRLSPVLLACLVVAVLACQSDEAKVSEHQARGEAYAEEGKHNEAIIEFKNVLQISPNSAAAHYGLAKSYLATNKLKEGYWELRESARLDPKNLDAKLQYGQLARVAGETEEALKQAEDVIAGDPTRAPAWVLKAQALEIQKKIEEARAAYQKAVEVAPETSPPLYLLAEFHMRQNEPAAAEPLFRKLTEVEPGFSSWGALAGFLARDRARDAEAEQAYRKALELAKPEELSIAYRVLASFHYARDHFDQSEAALKEGLEKVPGDLEIIYSLARFYGARGDEARADAMVEEATKTKPDDVAPYLVLSAYRGRKNDLPGALAAAESALKYDPTSRPARLRKAELLLDMGFRESSKEKIAEGRSIVDAVLATEPSSPEALFVRAKLDIAENRLSEATAGLRRAIDIRPDWPQAHFLLGSSLFLQGDRNGARAEVARALEIDADLLEARLLLARIHGALGEDELAIEQGRRVLRERPNDRATHILVAQSLVRQRRLDEAIQELEAIPDADRDAETWYAFGRTHIFRGKNEEARAALLKADALRPNHPEVLQSLLQLDQVEGKVAESVERIQRAVAAEPENAFLIHLQGLAYVLAGRGLEAEQSFRRAIDLNPNDMGPYQSLARYLASSGRQDETLATYEKALAARPDSGALHLIVGSLYEQIGNTDRAAEHYEKSIGLDPNLAAAKNNLAYLMAEQGKSLDRALDLAQEAKAALPDSPSAADTLGWVLFKKGVPAAAIGYLREAEGGFPPGDPNLGYVRHHLAQAHEANGEADKARETIERALAELSASQQAAKERGASVPEPPWAADARAMLERLGGGGAAAQAPAGG